jgi:predicted glycogen debranching enzyme
MSSLAHDEREWLEADGRGGFASGTVNGIRTRRYHGLLLPATTPPTGRMLLVNGLETWAVRGSAREPLTSHRYAGGIVHPDGASRLADFAWNPWPRRTFRLGQGGTIVEEILVVRRTGATIVAWTADAAAAGVEIEVRLLVSGRDYHALHHENAAVSLEPERRADALVFRLYEGVPSIVVAATGAYEQRADWYRRFLYTEEQARGLDCVEDLASPGVFRFVLDEGRACLVLATAQAALEGGPGEPLRRRVERWMAEEAQRRSAFASPLERAADAYIVSRGRGATIVAGYPWFTDWGRDTFIALRGLCLATGRLGEAGKILLEWADCVSEGMLPNRFPDRGEAPEFNAVDASLWFVVAADEFERIATGRPDVASPVDLARLAEAADLILAGYARGTRFGIRADEDGLLMAGTPGVQLTWMDARVGDRVVTPRIGKPVEIQALWLNALAARARRDPRWQALADRGLRIFAARFWNPDRGCLYDVVDVDHERGRVDASLRPNQILAVGGLPRPIVTGERAASVVATVERHLLAPLGLRSLAPGEPGYTPRYEGDVQSRDGAYHQGTVWPWLLGPFVEAWLRVRGDTSAARAEARARFVEPLLAHLDEAGLGHVSEITDAEPPFTPRGCPFQAWSVGEALRLDRLCRAAVGAPHP